MARPNHDTQRMDDLLASVTSNLLGDLPQNVDVNAIRVERILLEMVRPDPVQPRRMLPESIHLRFHQNQITPTRALRELVQIVQIAARLKDDRSTTCWSYSQTQMISVTMNPLQPSRLRKCFYMIWSI